MLSRYQAKSLDDIYLEDIPLILHPHAAQRYLSDTALPGRLIQAWDLPLGYSQFASQYYCFHFQRPWAVWRDVLGDVKSGRIVLLKPPVTGYALTEVLTATGSLRDDLPLFLHARLHDIIARQLKRPACYIRRSAPVQHAEAAGTINSKVAGRLLAAGGIYHGNTEGFRKAAEQLGGDALVGYSQVLNDRTRGSAITVASILAAISKGGMAGRVPFVLQSGGNILNKSTASALNEKLGENMTSREWGRALEALKKDNGLRNDFHGRILDNGNYVDSAGNVMGNLGDYVP